MNTCIHINVDGDVCGKRCYKHGNICAIHYRGIKSGGRGFIYYCKFCDIRTKSKFCVCFRCDKIYHSSVNRYRAKKNIAQLNNF